MTPHRLLRIRGVAAAALIALCLGSAGAHEGHGGHERKKSGPRPQGVLSLDVYADGETIHLLTAEAAPREKSERLLHKRSDDGGMTWSDPVRVDRGLSSVQDAHRSNDVQVAANGRQVIALWWTSGTGWGGSGPFVTAVSGDGGRTWQRGANPADDGRNDSHSFADLAAADGRFHLAWLDGRNGDQGVRYAHSDDGGMTWSRNLTVKDKVCECCWNTLVPGPERSLYLLFRDKAPRDMTLMLSRDSGSSWKRVATVGAFDWQIDACPHTGGALVFAPQRIHSVVWTGKAGHSGLHFLTSRDSGANWSKPERLGGETAQRSDLASRGEELAAVWDEGVGERTAILLARSSDGGSSWSKPVRLSPQAATASYPRVVATRSAFVVFWTEAEPGKPARLRIVTVK